MKGSSILIVCAATLALAGCEDRGGDSGTSVLESFSAPAIPREIGAFAMIDGEWTRITPYDWEGYFGGYPATKGMGAHQFPYIDAGSKMILNKMPVDPSNIYWTDHVTVSERRGSRGLFLTDIDAQGWPASVTEVEPGVYEVAVKGEMQGFHALVLKSGSNSFRAFFFNVQ